MSGSSPATKLFRWLPALLAALPVIVCLAGVLVRRAFPPSPEDAFPRLLIPTGASLLSKQPGARDECSAHTVARIGPVTPEVAASWARRLDLPCDADVDGGVACPSWSTAHRKDPFWGHAEDEPDGLDTVEARLDGTTLVVDWGDYLCAGPL